MIIIREAAAGSSESQSGRLRLSQHLAVENSLNGLAETLIVGRVTHSVLQLLAGHLPLCTHPKFSLRLASLRRQIGVGKHARLFHGVRVQLFSLLLQVHGFATCSVRGQLERPLPPPRGAPTSALRLTSPRSARLLYLGSNEMCAQSI